MPDINLYKWLEEQRDLFVGYHGYHPLQVMSQYGLHDCKYDVDEDGCKFVSIVFSMPPNVFSEIDGGTYGTHQGFRVYYDPADQAER